MVGEAVRETNRELLNVPKIKECTEEESKQATNSFISLHPIEEVDGSQATSRRPDNSMN